MLYRRLDLRFRLVCFVGSVSGCGPIPGCLSAGVGIAADASVADALDAGAVGADACSPSLKGDKGGKRADRQPEQERQPEKASGSDGIEPGTLGKGWTMVRVKPAYLALLLLMPAAVCGTRLVGVVSCGNPAR